MGQVCDDQRVVNESPRKISETFEFTEAEFRHPRKITEAEFWLMLHPVNACLKDGNSKSLSPNRKIGFLPWFCAKVLTRTNSCF